MRVAHSVRLLCKPYKTQKDRCIKEVVKTFQNMNRVLLCRGTAVEVFGHKGTELRKIVAHLFWIMRPID